MERDKKLLHKVIGMIRIPADAVSVTREPRLRSYGLDKPASNGE